MDMQPDNSYCWVEVHPVAEGKSMTCSSKTHWAYLLKVVCPSISAVAANSTSMGVRLLHARRRACQMGASSAPDDSQQYDFSSDDTIGSVDGQLIAPLRESRFDELDDLLGQTIDGRYRIDD